LRGMIEWSTVGRKGKEEGEEEREEAGRLH
jgi:hypothetical protein